MKSTRLERLVAWCYWVNADKDASRDQKLMADDIGRMIDIVRKAEYFKESEQLRDAYNKFEESEL